MFHLFNIIFHLTTNFYCVSKNIPYSVVHKANRKVFFFQDIYFHVSSYLLAYISLQKLLQSPKQLHLMAISPQKNMTNLRSSNDHKLL